MPVLLLVKPLASPGHCRVSSIPACIG